VLGLQYPCKGLWVSGMYWGCLGQLVYHLCCCLLTLKRARVLAALEVRAQHVACDDVSLIQMGFKGLWA
jgi:hypothetical protein